MICKSCGSTIPSALLSRDSFSCPRCGKVYRRGTGRSQSAPPQRKPAPAKPKKSAPARSARPVALPKWLLPAIAGALVMALIAGGLFLLAGRQSGGVYTVCGILKPGAIANGKSVTTTVEIPRKYGVDYIVNAESDTTGIVFSVKNKTETSFDLVSRNITGKERDPKVSWVLIPHAHLDEG